jgi:hypothetical protein
MPTATQRIKAFIESYRLRLEDGGVLDPADDKLLRQWQDDGGANRPLQALAEIVSRAEKVQRAAGASIDPDFQVEAAAFLIIDILNIRRLATIEDTLSTDLVDSYRRLKAKERKIKAKIAKQIRAIPVHHLSQYLAGGALALREARAPDKPIVQVRSGKGKARIQTLFIRELSKLIRDVTKK